MVDVIKTLTVEDIDKIVEKVEYRQTNFKEHLRMSIGVVLMNYGDSYVNVKCVGGEWSGTKGQLTLRDGIPLCPNQHPLLETSTAPHLALIGD